MTKEQFNFIEKISNHWFLRPLFTADILDFIACQFALESNFGTSRLATIQNNYCGMKKPFNRLHYGLSNRNLENKFLTYFSLDFCIIDYCAWFFYTRPHHNVSSDLEGFKIHLQNVGYCPEKGYIDRINLIYQSLISYKNEQN